MNEKESGEEAVKNVEALARSAELGVEISRIALKALQEYADMDNWVFDTYPQPICILGVEPAMEALEKIHDLITKLT